MLSSAFEALKTFDWGTDLSQVAAIEAAAVSVHGNPEGTRDLESQLIGALKGKLSRDAQEYVCRKLALVGSADAVPELGVRLTDPALSHMARFALERIPDAAAGTALLNAISRVTGTVRLGVISSLGVRGEAAAVPSLKLLLADPDLATSRAAARALGAIGGSEAAQALLASLASATANAAPIIDALLTCAETMLAGNQVAEASAIYQRFAAENQPRLVRLAATRGLLACGSHAG